MATYVRGWVVCDDCGLRAEINVKLGYDTVHPELPDGWKESSWMNHLRCTKCMEIKKR